PVILARGFAPRKQRRTVLAGRLGLCSTARPCTGPVELPRLRNVISVSVGLTEKTASPLRATKRMESAACPRLASKESGRDAVKADVEPGAAACRLQVAKPELPRSTRLQILNLILKLAGVADAELEPA